MLKPKFLMNYNKILQLKKRALLARLEKVEVENQRLRAEIDFLRGNPAIAKGLKGECLIATLLSARFSKKGAGHDLESEGQEFRMEVKYSSLLHVVPGRHTKRWVWSKLFGEEGKKNYQRLLLCGDTDPRFAKDYKDPFSPYVFLDLPYDKAVDFGARKRHGRYSRIDLTTNPRSIKSPRSRMLFEDFQLTATELQNRYSFFGDAEELNFNLS
jgi:hypothetical protein